MRSKMGIFAYFLCLLVILSASCRRNQPSLIDANHPPDTELWYAPPESTEYEYLVHIFWRGLDYDGTAARYIWTQTDTIIAGELAWNPAERLRDFRSGRITTRTDSIFSFSAYQGAEGGIGLKKNRQAFHIAAIDDRGVIDPTPARIEFVATIDKLPEMRFRVWREEILPSCDTPSNLTKRWRELRYDPFSPPTVGMFRPFKIAYEGFTTNGMVLEYKWFPLSTSITLPGANQWTTDLGDTIRDFPNTGNLALPSGVFRFAAQCRDAADALSIVDAGRYAEGVCQINVNFDPQTEIFKVINNYVDDGVPISEEVNFLDDKPDTVPFRSWITLYYVGENDSIVDLPCNGDVLEIPIPRDSSICTDDTNQCLKYQVSFIRSSERYEYAYARSAWLPQNGEDNNPYGVTDSTSMNMGSVEYEVFVRTLDEYGLEDGTPAMIELVGNFDPTLESFYVKDHLGNEVHDGDTLTWNWWKWADSTASWLVPPAEARTRKKFYFTIEARGRDHPKESDTGVEAWFYNFFDLEGNFQRFARSASWVEGASRNVLSDTFKVTFSWNPFYPAPDIQGDSVFANLPEWINQTYDFEIRGRDTRNGQQFAQFMWVDGKQELINSYPTSLLGRWTELGRMRFYIRLIRPGY
jgi:hypothetical protein